MYTNKKFRLCELNIRKDNILGDLLIKFKEDEYEIEDENIFTTVIIGENGVGKSYILSLLTNIFIELKSKKMKINSSSTRRIDNYSIRYKIGNDNYFIDKNQKKIECTYNGKSIQISRIELPEKLLACSYMVNDKFPYQDTKVNNCKDFYEYLGIKGSKTGAGTKSFIKKVANNIVESSMDKEFIDGLKDILEFLNLKKSIELCYEVRKKNIFFNGNLTKSEFYKYFNNSRKNRKTEPFSLKTFNEIKDTEEIDIIIEFINQLSYKIIKHNGKSCIIFNLDLKDEYNNKDLNENLDKIKRLMSLDLLSTPGLIIQKSNIYNLEDGSSGESHFLFTITNILSKIKNSSLILIDEPEISMHPKWQMRYVNTIKKIFSRYNDCQIIIATHSHFIISDLNKKSSSIVSLKVNEDFIVNSNIEKSNTYGWSAENILYNIFEVSTTRNYYLANFLDELLLKISKGDIKYVTCKMDELISLEKQLVDADPLKTILIKIIERVNKNE